jgi:ankyrin repeat protein
VRYSTIPIIKMLIGYGADVDKLDLYGNGALIYSIHDEEKILELLRAGANINVRYGDGKTLLTKAVMDEDYRTMEMLLRLRINPNIKDLAGYPPLYYAKEKNNNKSINLLVSYGAKEWSATIEEEDYE